MLNEALIGKWLWRYGVEVGSRSEVWVYRGQRGGGVGAPRLFKGHMGLACGSISNKGGELSIT